MFDKIVSPYMRIMARGHFVMSIIKGTHLISEHFWAYGLETSAIHFLLITLFKPGVRADSKQNAGIL